MQRSQTVGSQMCFVCLSLIFQKNSVKVKTGSLNIQFEFQPLKKIEGLTTVSHCSHVATISGRG